jgi:pilus assembly protein Flp/PilA
MNQPREPRPARRADERGATAVEYALMVGLIALVIVTGVTAFGISVNNLFNITF